MTKPFDRSIIEESFAIIDREVGEHALDPQMYAIARRAIHATADFDFLHLLEFTPDAIELGMQALRDRTPIVTDVGMVRLAIATQVARTFGNFLASAVETVETALPGRTRTETGLLACCDRYPEAIYVIGNAPTALLALSEAIARGNARPSLVVAAPVGFVSVVEAKQAIAQTAVPQIRVRGRKGGSAVAGAILNALLTLAASD